MACDEQIEFAGDPFALEREVGDRHPALPGADTVDLRNAEPAADIELIDAFSSDSVPAHLLTAEAVELYRRKLAPGGILAFHISNRYMELRSLLAALGEKAGLAVTCH
jgi:hypothetical protein